MSSEFTRLIIRQGRENERQEVVFRSGEPAYTVDYKRLFMGDDTTPGGVSVGMKFIGFCEFDPDSNRVEGVNPGYTGDIIFETSTNVLYLLSGDDYRDKTKYISINRSPVPDNVNLYNNNNRISIIPNSLNFSLFAGFSIGRGLERNNNFTLRLSNPGAGLGFNSNNQLEIQQGAVLDNLLAPMGRDTVKARLGQAGAPSNITLREFANAISGFIAESNSVGSVGVPVGTIIDFAGTETSIPRGYLICDGSEHLKADYPTLAQILGTSWGVSENLKFTLPNLMGRVTMGAGVNYFSSTSGINTDVGSYGGAYSVELQKNQIPRHNHEFRINLPFDTETPAVTGIKTRPVWGSTDGGQELGAFGSIVGQPHLNIQPSAVVYKLIKAK
jgi:microcystin-dependent protein